VSVLPPEADGRACVRSGRWRTIIPLYQPLQKISFFGPLLIPGRRRLGRRLISRRDGAEVLRNRRQNAARHLAEGDAEAVLTALAKRADGFGRGNVNELDIASDCLRALSHRRRDVVGDEKLADALLIFELSEPRAIGLGRGARLRELPDAADSPTTRLCATEKRHAFLTSSAQ
jgi:hypothetical protein